MGKRNVPSVCRFFGISIYIYYNDHAPPHFHAVYGDCEALYVIDTLEILGGQLPRRAHSMVLEWATIHRMEIRSNWQNARNGTELVRIAPLE